MWGKPGPTIQFILHSSETHPGEGRSLETSARGERLEDEGGKKADGSGTSSHVGETDDDVHALQLVLVVTREAALTLNRKRQDLVQKYSPSTGIRTRGHMM